MVWRKRRHLSPGKRWLLCLLALSVTAAVLIVRMQPVVREYAESRARILAEQIANEAVAQVLSEQTSLCRSMLRVSYNEQQVLSSVIADAGAVNAIKTAVAALVADRMAGISSVNIGVPLGTLIGSEWFSGWGPLVPFSIGVTSRVLTTVSSSLEAVGINQSAFRLLLHVHISLSVVTPQALSSVSVDTAFPMAETVLLGDVPDNLTEVYGDDQTLLGKIFDYGTGE